jgi:hypothetical protein
MHAPEDEDDDAILDSEYGIGPGPPFGELALP